MKAGLRRYAPTITVDLSLPIHILGGGLAGSEAAWQVARAGLRAVLYEMRPVRSTPAHKTGELSESYVRANAAVFLLGWAVDARSVLLEIRPLFDASSAMAEQIDELLVRWGREVSG